MPDSDVAMFTFKLLEYPEREWMEVCCMHSEGKDLKVRSSVDRTVPGTMPISRCKRCFK
jgi:hypothetical protein